jgi:ATP-dependent exoDNAse (exonuclease V) alpha subunit
LWSGSFFIGDGADSTRRAARRRERAGLFCFFTLVSRKHTDDRRVTYDRDSIADLTPGYAITIHRSQGSEYPFVIIPIHESQGIMLTRELLYTALTRGKRMVVLIGSLSAFAQAVTSARSHRLTGLKDLLTPPATVTPAMKAA